MKVIVFDVGNAACSVISSPNNYCLMIDCGSSSEKTNPVDCFFSNKNWLNSKPFVTCNGNCYELGLLHITHPDDDHVKNAKRIKEEMPPYLLQRRQFEEFPQNEQINEDYKTYFDKQYRGTNPEEINWGFNSNKTFQIPMNELKNNELLIKKLKNNSSILRYIEYLGVKLLFAGDMEKEGWEWLAINDKGFINTMKNGLDILIAPHHGHKSGFPKKLFELTKEVQFVIHSKGS